MAEVAATEARACLGSGSGHARFRSRLRDVHREKVPGSSVEQVSASADGNFQRAPHLGEGSIVRLCSPSDDHGLGALGMLTCRPSDDTVTFCVLSRGAPATGWLICATKADVKVPLRAFMVCARQPGALLVPELLPAAQAGQAAGCLRGAWRIVARNPVAIREAPSEEAEQCGQACSGDKLEVEEVLPEPGHFAFDENGKELPRGSAAAVRYWLRLADDQGWPYGARVMTGRKSVLAKAMGQGDEQDSQQPPAPDDLAILPAEVRRSHLGSLNSSQRQALEHFLQSPRRLALLQGPPGSGKSATILVLLRAIVDGGLLQRGEIVVVSGPTNKAVHHLAHQALSRVTAAGGSSAMGRTRLALVGVAESLPGLRPEGLPSGAAPPLLNDVFVHGAREAAVARLARALQQLNEGDAGGAVASLSFVARSLAHCAPGACQRAELHQLASRAREHCNTKDLSGVRRTLQDAQRRVEELPPEEVERDILQNCDVLFGTLATLGRFALRRDVGRTVRWAIVDEAAQPTEAETLLLLQWDPQKALLVGDPQQLSATVVSRAGQACLYSRSLMGRLLEAGQPFQMLEEQYRMHPEISRFPAAYFYGGRLRDARLVRRLPSKQQLIFWDGTVGELPQYLVVNETNGCESAGAVDRASCSNEAEAVLAVHIAKTVASTAEFQGQEDVGRSGKGIICLLTFYQGQVLLLQRELDHQAAGCPTLRDLCRGGRVAVHSVDSFQGSEAEVVVLSCVRTRQLGFLTDDRRLNVALTRAQKQLLVLANVGGLRHAPLADKRGRRPALLEMLADASQRHLVLRSRYLKRHLTAEDSTSLWLRVAQVVLEEAGGTLHFQNLERRAARSHALSIVGKNGTPKRRRLCHFGVKALACLPDEWLSHSDGLIRLPQ